MSKTKTIPRVLLYAGLLGHEFVLIERSDRDDAVDGWISRAETNSLESAQDYARKDREFQVWQRLPDYERDSEKWRLAAEGNAG